MVRARKTHPIHKADAAAMDMVVPTPSFSGSALENEADTPITATVEVSEPLIQHLPTPLSAWNLCADTVIGLVHRRNRLPCQDAVASRNSPRPILALSDGAGSAAISERGAQTLVTGITRFMHTLEDELMPWLDDGEDTAQAQVQAIRWAERLRQHARGLLTDLAQAERREVHDVRATLLVVAIGKCRIFWWQVGDGAIVAKNPERMWSLGNQASAKGEFANQTCFVDTANASDVQFGLLSSQEIIGIAMMSDGGAEKLVARDGSKVANRLGEWLNDVAEQRFTIDTITLAFHERAMWERTNLDDRSIVLAARLVPPTKISES